MKRRRKSNKLLEVHRRLTKRMKIFRRGEFNYGIAYLKIPRFNKEFFITGIFVEGADRDTLFNYLKVKFPATFIKIRWSKKKGDWIKDNGK